MRRVAVVLAAVVGLVSNAAGSDIEGKIVGRPPNFPSIQHPAVVWLDGVQMKSPEKNTPVLAQHGGQFVPSFLIVVAGQTVAMPNEDEVAHNVYSMSPAKQFDLGYYAKGDIKSVTFDRPGIVDVLCLIHTFMRAKILVVPNPYYATIAADGTFRIRNVPAGTLTLTFWGDEMTSFAQNVTVPEGVKAVSVRVAWPSSSSSSSSEK
jgi:plastocyanin